ncbi:hypothetical protein Gogos_012678 [Gossypium gossypioides]|uniref:Uncharacterized protein n=1 Tax=Gossypium gossypioides TaxID=34282 RepID=A0A7J9BT81_GOSGO|nr:hypothetical protein [Gossypium gossypioides]
MWSCKSVNGRAREFEVIQLDDYDYVLGLKFLDRTQTVLYPWAEKIHIVISPLSKIVVPVHRDMKVEMCCRQFN